VTSGSCKCLRGRREEREREREPFIRNDLYNRLATGRRTATTLRTFPLVRELFATLFRNAPTHSTMPAPRSKPPPNLTPLPAPQSKCPSLAQAVALAPCASITSQAQVYFGLAPFRRRGPLSRHPMARSLPHAPDFTICPPQPCFP
jgi:hypothetical protein